MFGFPDELFLAMINDPKTGLDISKSLSDSMEQVYQNGASQENDSYSSVPYSKTKTPEIDFDSIDVSQIPREKYFDFSLYYFNEGDYSSAEKLSSIFLEADPQYSWLWILKGLSLYIEKRYVKEDREKAIESFGKAISCASDLNEAKDLADVIFSYLEMIFHAQQEKYPNSIDNGKYSTKSVVSAIFPLEWEIEAYNTTCQELSKAYRAKANSESSPFDKGVTEKCSLKYWNELMTRASHTVFQIGTYRNREIPTYMLEAGIMATDLEEYVSKLFSPQDRGAAYGSLGSLCSSFASSLSIAGRDSMEYRREANRLIQRGKDADKASAAGQPSKSTALKSEQIKSNAQSDELKNIGNRVEKAETLSSSKQTAYTISSENQQHRTTEKAKVSEVESLLSIDIESLQKKGKEKRKKALLLVCLLLVCVALAFLTISVIIPAVKYSSATKLLNAGEYEEAMVRFEEIADYKDSTAQIDACKAGITENKYQAAMVLFDEGDYDEAVASFTELSDYKDSKTMVSESKYQKALKLYKGKDFDAANEVFTTIKSYKDSKNLIHTHDYQSEVTTEPLCDTKGTMTYCCTLDGCTNTYTEDIPALGHDYKEKVIKANTCESDGESSYTCTRCGDTYTETTKAIGHNYAAATCTKPETCKNCGKTKGTALGHTANAVVCSRCGAVSNITADYSVVDGCKITGYTVGKPYTTGSGYMKFTYVDVSVTITRISDNSSSPAGNYVACCYYETTTYGSSLYWSIESPKELNSGSITVKKSISVGNSKAIKLVLQK